MLPIPLRSILPMWQLLLIRSVLTRVGSIPVEEVDEGINHLDRLLRLLMSSVLMALYFLFLLRGTQCLLIRLLRYCASQGLNRSRGRRCQTLLFPLQQLCGVHAFWWAEGGAAAGNGGSRLLREQMLQIVRSVREEPRA
jgi:hypothetical protein